MIDTNLILKEMQDNGFYILKNFLSKEKCKFFVNQLNSIQEIRVNKMNLLVIVIIKFYIIILLKMMYC